MSFVDVAAQMIRDVPGIRMIVEEAGIPQESVNWNGAPRAIWASVLAEERNAHRVGAVLRVLQGHYPENDELWAAGMEYIHQVERSQRQPTIADIATGTDHVAALVEHLHESLNQQMVSLREEVRTLAARMNGLENRLEARMGATEQALSMVNVATPFRRAAWMMGFALFTLPMPLFLEEIRRGLGVALPMSIAILLVVWSASAIAFLYGLGFIRDRR